MIRQPRVSRQLMHVSDWLPTLYSAAGGNVEDLGDIDGVDMWRSLVTGHGSPRSEVPAQHRPHMEHVRPTRRPLQVPQRDIRRWPQEPPSYRDSSSSAARSNNLLDRTCAVARTILSIGRTLPKHSPWEVMTECGQPRKSECKPLEKPCLFDIERDPCEIDNIADDYPHVLRSLENRLQQHKKTMVPPLNKPPTRRSDPEIFRFHLGTLYGHCVINFSGVHGLLLRVNHFAQ
ncbi:hypothetical protein MRX96_040674 [Rhipicephalus microplus]